MGHGGLGYIWRVGVLGSRIRGIGDRRIRGYYPGLTRMPGDPGITDTCPGCDTAGVSPILRRFKTLNTVPRFRKSRNRISEKISEKFLDTSQSFWAVGELSGCSSGYPYPVGGYFDMLKAARRAITRTGRRQPFSSLGKRAVGGQKLVPSGLARGYLWLLARNLRGALSITGAPNRYFSSQGEGKSWVDPRALPQGENLKKYTIDLTALAKQGKLDPVIGRDSETRRYASGYPSIRAIEILSRRTKNNPVLIGEPGVGKTAIVEGLAQRIVNNE
eukprot:133404-Amorphochlora_amoeboformis.AAC.1